MIYLAVLVVFCSSVISVVVSGHEVKCIGEVLDMSTSDQQAATDCIGLFTIASQILTITQQILELEEQQRRQEQSESARVPRQRLYLRKLDWKADTEHMHDIVFKARYRMTPSEFQRLFDLILPEIQSRHPTEHSLPEENRLGMTLRFLAGGSYLDLSHIHGIHPESAYRIVEKVMFAILKKLDTHYPIRDTAELARIGAGFASRSDDVWTKCCGALDGCIIRINRPSPSCSGNPDDYYCRKECYAINMLAICDSNYMFRWFTTSFPGSTNDSIAFNMSPLGQELREHPLPDGYWIAADGGVCLHRKCHHTIWPQRVPAVRRQTHIQLLSQLHENAY